MTGPHVRCTLIVELVDVGETFDLPQLEQFRLGVIAGMFPELALLHGVITRQHLNVPEQLIELGFEMAVPIPQ